MSWSLWLSLRFQWAKILFSSPTKLSKLRTCRIPIPANSANKVPRACSHQIRFKCAHNTRQTAAVQVCMTNWFRWLCRVTLWILPLIWETTCALAAALFNLRSLMRQPKLSGYAKALLRDFGAEKKIMELNLRRPRTSMMTLDSDIRTEKLYWYRARTWPMLLIFSTRCCLLSLKTIKFQSSTMILLATIQHSQGRSPLFSP